MVCARDADLGASSSTLVIGDSPADIVMGERLERERRQHCGRNPARTTIQPRLLALTRPESVSVINAAKS